MSTRRFPFHVRKVRAGGTPAPNTRDERAPQTLLCASPQMQAYSAPGQSLLCHSHGPPLPGYLFTPKCAHGAYPALDLRPQATDQTTSCRRDNYSYSGNSEAVREQRRPIIAERRPELLPQHTSFATARPGTPSPLKSPTATEFRRTPGIKRDFAKARSGTQRPFFDGGANGLRSTSRPMAM